MKSSRREASHRADTVWHRELAAWGSGAQQHRSPRVWQTKWLLRGEASTCLIRLALTVVLQKHGAVHTKCGLLAFKHGTAGSAHCGHTEHAVYVHFSCQLPACPAHHGAHSGVGGDGGVADV